MAQHMVYVGSLDGTGPILKEVPVNISQAIVKGSILVKATNKASVAAAAAAAGTVWGVAAADITTGGSVTAADVVKIDVNPMSVYEMPYTGTGTPAVGVLYDLGANAYTANLDDTTGGYIECIKAISNGKTGRAQFSVKNRVQLV